MEKEIENLRKEHEKDLDCITALTEEIESLKEQLQNQKLNELQSKKKQIEDEIDKENYRIFMSTPRTPIRQEDKQEEPKAKTLDEILMED